MKSNKIALLGDTIEDHYIHCDNYKPNPESLAPLVVESQRQIKPGGAANVYKNLQSLGVDCDFFTVEHEVSVKTRILHKNQILLRVDKDIKANNKKLLEQIDQTDFSVYEWIVISDYNKGALYPIELVMEKLKPFRSKIIVDPKCNLQCYAGVFGIKPNLKEFEQSVGDLTKQSLEKFARDNDHELVVVTTGEKGYAYYWQQSVHFVPARSANCIDVTGAGDSFLSGMIYSLSKDNNVIKSLSTGNLAAARCVEHMGTYQVTEKEINETVVFTNGCFDILHKGHISLLKQSRKLGDRLIVGLNSDTSVKRLKGANRPVVDQETRKRTLELLDFVDEVVIFEEDTPYELIKSIQPDIITKGGDYTTDTVVGNELAEVVIFPLVCGYSTTKIIENTWRFKKFT